jgi:anion-transporting  ArsA/GET3 family ATPase
MNQLRPEVTADTGMLPLLQHKRVLVTVGAGGVGKTTTAAAIGLLGARAGRRSLVMTIDPAWRLAASLGLHGGLDHQERPVPAEKMRAADLPGDLLHAMMLDQKQAFDEVIRRQAPDEGTVHRVMQNKLYQELSSRLAGGQEYAAMEKLYELTRGERYQLIVLDTPPTANALDFLDAPQKMVDLLDSPVVSLFVRAYGAAGRFSFKALSTGAAFVFRRLARFVGGELLDDIAQYFSEMKALLAGFRQRAAKVIELLSGDDVGFVIVASPDRRAIDEAVALYHRLRQGGMAPVGFVINRVHPRQDLALDPGQVQRAVQRCGVDPAVAGPLSVALLRAHRQLQGLAAVDEAEIGQLRRRCGAEHNYISVPLFDDDIFDIAGLLRLCEHLA